MPREWWCCELRNNGHRACRSRPRTLVPNINVRDSPIEDSGVVGTLISWKPALASRSLADCTAWKARSCQHRLHRARVGKLTSRRCIDKVKEVQSRLLISIHGGIRATKDTTTQERQGGAHVEWGKWFGGDSRSQYDLPCLEL